MHTTHELNADSFEYRRDGQPVRRAAVMPAVGIDGRLGVVMAAPEDGLGAGNFVLSCVTEFYDRLRERGEVFSEYPDYYTFPASPDTLDYLEFDVWPDHENVPVAPDPERVLRAVNDRAGAVLRVPFTGGSDPDVDDVTLRSAERRIDSCYQYAPDGRFEMVEFSIHLPRANVEEWYRATVDTAEAESVTYTPSGTGEPYVSQQFRALGLEEALRHLPTEH